MALGRKYTATIDAISISAVADLFWIGAPTDAIVIVNKLRIGQDASENSEQLPVRMFRTTTDNAAVGTANTPNPHEVGSPAFGGTVRTNITGASLSAETTMLDGDPQNVLNGWLWMFPETEDWVLSPVAGTAGRMAFKLDAAPAAALTITASLTFTEIGG